MVLPAVRRPELRAADTSSAAVTSRGVASGFTRLISPLRLAAVLAVVAALASALTVLVRLPVLLSATYRYSDAPELSYIAQGLATGHGPQTLPTQTSIIVVWLQELVSPLPFHAAFDFLVGPALALIAIVVMVLTARRLMGQHAWHATAVVLLVLPPTVLWTLLFPDNHVTTLLGMALLAWLLVTDLIARGRRGANVVVGLLCGVLTVSDPQLLVTGVIPYIVVGLTAHWRWRDVAVRPFLITAAGVAAGAIGTEIVMAMQGIHLLSAMPGTPLALNVTNGATIAVQTAVWMALGSWYGAAVTATGLAMLTVALLAVGVAIVRSRRTPRVAREIPAGDVASFGYRCFWLVGIAGLLAAFLVLGYGHQPLDGHYLMPCYFGAAALAAAWFTSALARTITTRPRLRAQPAVAAATLAFAAFAAHTAYANATIDPANFNDHRAVSSASDPLALLTAHHLSRGYASYWLAYDLDWRSEGAVSIWPVLAAPAACGGHAGSLCAYPFAPQGEYTPAAGPSFLVTESIAGRCLPGVPPLAVFGAPTAVYRVGTTTVSVYSYDVATRFSRATEIFC
jgi:hypothetical protein